MASAQLSLLPADQFATWNGITARYAAYCSAHGAATPDEQLARDRARWPGGCMAGFIVWCGERWREWEQATGRKPPHGLDDHRDFDAWLSSAPGPPSSTVPPAAAAVNQEFPGGAS